MVAVIQRHTGQKGKREERGKRKDEGIKVMDDGK